MKVRFDYQDCDEVCKFLEKLPKSSVSIAPYGKAQIARGKELFTENACDCGIIGFSNGKKSIMSHLIPDKDNIENLKDFSKLSPLKADLLETLQKDIDKLKKEGGEINAFLIAGMVLENFSRRSISLMEGLLTFLRKNDIEPTIVWGQKESLNAHYSTKKNTLTIYPKLHDINPNSLKKYFKIMKFNPKDKALLPNNQPISTGYLTQNDEYVSYTKDLFKDLGDQSPYAFWFPHLLRS